MRDPDRRLLARQMRLRPTPEEAMLWRVLKGRQRLGFHFRRQHGVGRYILDFYCHQAKLCLEVDGAGHDTPEGRAMDEERDAWLDAAGITVLRIPNRMVRLCIDDVIDRIEDRLREGPQLDR